MVIITNYEYFNYTDLGIISSKIPYNLHLFMEGQGTYDGNIYMIQSGNTQYVQKSTDKGDNWSQNAIGAGLPLVFSFYDPSNDEILFLRSDGTFFEYELSDDSLTARAGTGFDLTMDVFGAGGNIYVIGIVETSGDAILHIERWDGGGNFTVIGNSYNMGTIGARTYAASQMGIDGANTWFLFKWSDENVKLWRRAYASSTAIMMEDCGANTQLAPVAQAAITYDDNDVLYFVLQDTSDSKYYLHSYVISTDTHTKLGEYNISLMLERNTESGVLEKGFHLTEDKVYQIPSFNKSNLNFISNFNFGDTIVAISDTFIMDASGNMYEFIDKMGSIFEGWIYHSRNYFPYLEMKYNSDDITIIEGQFIQIIGPYTADGSTTADQVIFEGIAVKPTKGRIQYVLIENQGSEMEHISPRGNKSGRTDQIIIDINNDGAPNGPTYIHDGTLANGDAMGLLDLSGAKIYRTVLNDFAEHDVFLWALRPQGALDYNAGGVDSGADLRLDISTYTDIILQVQAWTIPQLNQIIVNGAINTITGEPYTGKWDDIVHQQTHGINSITIEDSQLNSNALCQAKADGMGGNEVDRTRVRFKFRKITYGLIQSSQTITFKYDIPNYITIAEAQFILDKLTMNIKTEVGYAEISSGL